MITLPLPAYVVEITDENDRQAAEAQFRLRLAALFLTRGGKLAPLAKSCGLHEKAISALTNVSPELAIKIEKVLGRELFPREFFRPDLFIITE